MTPDAMGTPTPRAPRFDLRVPVRYRAFGGDDWHAGSTENMSRTGLLFRADRLLPVSTSIEMLVTLPIGPGGSEIRCRGRVVRAVPSAAPDSLPAVAATIATYSFLSDSGSPA